ncbi:hypothetical protein [Acinetobacter oleivorans]|uniref:hypothetical protein n=1 Tax=Acinetobacter oleivorans TaxID=1148157 RepID=UPI003A855DAA
MNISKICIRLLIGIQLLGINQLVFAEWKEHVKWSFHDTGAPDCPEQYLGAGGPDCLVMGTGGGTGTGNRSCLMAKARADAERGRCTEAIQKLIVTQCHNSKAKKEIIAANDQEVCDYIRKSGKD